MQLVAITKPGVYIILPSHVIWYKHEQESKTNSLFFGATSWLPGEPCVADDSATPLVTETLEVFPAQIRTIR